MSTDQPSESDQADLIKKKDLSVTALYTAQTWVWGNFKGADLYESDQTRGVFGVTNLVLGVARLFKWRTPSLHHSLVQRHTLIDQWLQQHQTHQIIELASGLSARSIRLIDQVEQYVEVDLEHMIEFKKNCLEQKQPSHLHHEKMSWVAFDLHQLTSEDIQEWVEEHKSTALIAEGLMMYLTQPQQKRLWTLMADSLPTQSYLIFDFVPAIEQPKAGFIGRILRWCMHQFTGGQSFVVDQRSRDTIQQELHQCGFREVFVFDVSHPDHQAQFELPFQNKRTQNLIFIALT